MDELNLKDIESQLRCPSGEKGVEMGEMMHESNLGMTLAAIKALFLKENDVVLELGHGNAKHVPALLEEYPYIKYYGLDISETMYIEAVKHTKSLGSRVEFKMYEGDTLPFNDNSFNKIFTVNTIYFWESPVSMLTELFRVLKPDGLLSIVFAQKKFMEQLPFVQNAFKLYNNKLFEALVSKSAFEILEFQDLSEGLLTNTGDEVSRDFAVYVLKKKG
ncbi:class I SAM-dependent methyltransferase [Galbibacter sp. BG1]|uniref:class I SAM-dependent methyltransferase n=1 Tax=Galbibacter sp. BG1 TaxID=1170699 RepID=UPI0015BE8CC9|nr:class I SAM-dependent methyltransferase [Galbibacter sp. BG1]QLE02087.1 class I SAM-dependent methyltransferase [Galbibacter sp. BG1]